ncbi:hypothetical protein TIFTF001_033415 [Ficus carica]|uniref:Uncharacterized protein n=1 Tax=Ficus carica TaxID=3494 RepID=A0AA88J957_FICCA|nr:hypothetical protein TIFTF001_033415 [Ficus carica]
MTRSSPTTGHTSRLGPPSLCEHPFGRGGDKLSELGTRTATSRSTRTLSANVTPAPVSRSCPRWTPKAYVPIGYPRWPTWPGRLEHPDPRETPINRGRTHKFRYHTGVPIILRCFILLMIDGGATGWYPPVYSTTLGVVVGIISRINILVLEGGPPPFQ